MKTKTKRSVNVLVVVVVFLSSLACQALFPKVIQPGSLEEKVAEGNVRFTGRGNVTYIGCQNPTAEVSLYIGPKTKELDGEKFNTYVNPVTIDVITDGSMIKMEECQISNVGENYNWPAKGIYYAVDNKIIFYLCTQNEEKAEGVGYLEGEGFEGEYACWDRDGGLMYEVAFSAYEMSR